MKKLLLLLFLGFTLVGFSQTTLIPDPNFEQGLIDLGYDTAPINGSVPTANISNVTSLEVGYRNIADLTGLEDFTDLTNLLCSNNNLTSLDISQNTALTYLDCNNNQLPGIDVSNNTALITLYCYNNQLTSLDLSIHIALASLYCFNNQLTSLDLSINTALASLYCFNNQLTSLDVRNGNNFIIDAFDTTNNPNLTCIYVDDVDYSNANWPGIDPNSTFVENEAECALSIGDNTLELDVFIYPNPTNDYLFIEGNKNPIAVSIYNLLGAEVIANSNTDKINVSKLSKGIYIIRISDGVNQADKKFIKN
jgi:hypothetical protein